MSLLQRLRRLILNFSQAQISAGAGSVVDYGLMVLSVEVFHWDLFWAVACGGVVGAIINFSLNRLQDRQAHQRSLRVRPLQLYPTALLGLPQGQILTRLISPSRS